MPAKTRTAKAKNPRPICGDCQTYLDAPGVTPSDKINGLCKDCADNPGWYGTDGTY